MSSNEAVHRTSTLALNLITTHMLEHGLREFEDVAMPRTNRPHLTLTILARDLESWVASGFTPLTDTTCAAYPRLAAAGKTMVQVEGFVHTALGDVRLRLGYLTDRPALAVAR